MDDSDMEYLDISEETPSFKRRKIVDDQINSADPSERDYDSDPDFNPMMELEEVDTTMEALVEGSDDLGRSRTKKGNLRRKKKSMLESIPMKCEECSSVLTGLSSLKAHVKRMHLKERNFECHICAKAFFTVTHREDHIISVHTRRCNACNSDVIESTPWEEGITKKDLRVAECPCGNQVKFISKVGRVKAEAEGEENQGVPMKPKKKKSLAECTPMTCEHCGLIVTGKSSLMAHVKRQHLKEFNHKCEICLKEFFTSTHLETHVLSVHTRKCKNCNEFVIEREPWPENMDRTQERILTCNCGTEVRIFTKLGPKPSNGEETPGRKKKQKAPSDTRYVCGTCGKIFLKKVNAMNHKCSSKHSKEAVKMIKCTLCGQEFSNENELKVHHKFTHEYQNINLPQSENVDAAETPQFKVEEDNFILEEGTQVVMYDQSGDQSASGITSVQIMHEGKLVPAEQIVDEQGNVSFILKTD